MELEPIDGVSNDTCTKEDSSIELINSIKEFKSLGGTIEIVEVPEELLKFNMSLRGREENNILYIFPTTRAGDIRWRIEDKIRYIKQDKGITGMTEDVLEALKA